MDSIDYQRLQYCSLGEKWGEKKKKREKTTILNFSLQYFEIFLSLFFLIYCFGLYVTNQKSIFVIRRQLKGKISITKIWDQIWSWRITKWKPLWLFLLNSGSINGCWPTIKCLWINCMPCFGQSTYLRGTYFRSKKSPTPPKLAILTDISLFQTPR